MGAIKIKINAPLILIELHLGYSAFGAFIRPKGNMRKNDLLVKLIEMGLNNLRNA